MSIEMKACCFSGHRIEKLTVSEKVLKEILRTAVVQAISDGFTVFYHGGCTGVDLIAAEAVLELRLIEAQKIKLIGVLPFEGQEKYWDTTWKERYNLILKKCDELITLHKSYLHRSYQERNQYMVDRSQRLIAVYDGRSLGGTRNTILYAMKRGVELQIIKL